MRQMGWGGRGERGPLKLRTKKSHRKKKSGQSQSLTDLQTDADVDSTAKAGGDSPGSQAK